MRKMLETDKDGVYIIPPSFLIKIKNDYNKDKDKFEAVFIDYCHYTNDTLYFYGFYEKDEILYYRKLNQSDYEQHYKWHESKPENFYGTSYGGVIDKIDFEIQLEIADIMGII